MLALDRLGLWVQPTVVSVVWEWCLILEVEGKTTDLFHVSSALDITPMTTLIRSS